MFRSNTFQVGKPVPLEHPSYLLPMTLVTPRNILPLNNYSELIPGQEILNAYSEGKRYDSIEKAQEEACSIARKEKMESSNPSMKYECPIFEMQQDKLVYIHFQGVRLEANHPLFSEKPQVTSCLLF